MGGRRMEIDPRLGGTGSAGNAFNWAPKPAAPADAEDQLGYNPQIECGYDEQLRDARRDNKNKLRRRFEHIFDKYERDFDGIGDEIDLTTGAIIVDNGHLQNMRNEVDVGVDVGVQESSEAQQDAEENAGMEGEVTGQEQDHEHRGRRGPGTDYDADSDGGDSSYEHVGDNTSSQRDSTAGSATSLFGPDELSPDIRLTSRLRKDLMHTSDVDSTGRTRSTSIASSVSGVPSEQESSIDTTADNILDRVPGLKESMLALQSQYKQGQSVDQDAIQALGMSIANQLASFVSGCAPQKPKRKLGDYNEGNPSFAELSMGPPSKRPRRSPSPFPVEEPSPNEKSLWAPGGHPRRMAPKRKKADEAAESFVQVAPAAERIPEDAPSDLEDGPNTIQTSELLKSRHLRKCHHCGATESHIWRKGPQGILCNSCGMYLYRYGLMRPLDVAEDDDDLRSAEASDGEMDPLLRDWLDWQDAGKKDHPKPTGVQNNRFELDEDALLIRLKEIEAFTWEKMATHFPGRSAYALQCRYSKKLQHTAQEARDLLLSEGYRGSPDANGITMFSYVRVPFTDGEDELLLKLRDTDGLEWADVAAAMEARSPEALEQRYREIAIEVLGRRRRASSTVPSRPQSREGSADTYNKRYTFEEDAQIIKMREVDKLGWAAIAAELPSGRNSFALQKRYTKELCGRHPDSKLPSRKAYDHQESLQYVRRQSAPPESTCMPRRKSTRSGAHDLLDPALASGAVTVARQIDNGDLASLHKTFGLAAGGFGLGTRLPLNLLPFTEDEDRLIVKLRELDHLPWPVIAERLHGRSIPCISDRYYHALLPLKARALEATIRGSAIPASSNIFAEVLSAEQTSEPTSSNRWTTQETDLVVAMRQQGKSWKEISERLPGRTARASEGHHAMICGKKKKQHTFVATSTANTEAPLLKQAFSNARRLSASNLAEEGGNSRPNLTSGKTTAPARTRYRLLLPSPFAGNASTKPTPSVQRPLPPRPASVSARNRKKTETKNPKRTTPGRPGVSNSEAAAPSSQTKNVTTESTTPRRATEHNAEASQDVGMEDNSCFLTPSHPVHVRHSSVEPTPFVVANYDTPARYNPQSHPYFLNPPEALGPPISDGLLQSKRIGGSQINQGVKSHASPNLARIPKAGRVLARPSKDLGRRTEDSDVAVETRHTSTRKYRPRQLASKRSIGARSKADEVAVIETQTPRIRRKPGRPIGKRAATQTAPPKRKRARRKKPTPVEETSDDEESIVYQESDDDDVMDDDTTSDEEESESIFLSGISPKKHQSEVTNPSARLSGRSSCKHVRLENTSPVREERKYESVQTPSGPQDEAGSPEPPPYSIIQLCVMALETKAPVPMRTVEIYTYLERRFEWCRTFDLFRNRVRATLSYAAQFEKSDKLSKNTSGWLLTGAPLSAQNSRPLSAKHSKKTAEVQTPGEKTYELKKFAPRLPVFGPPRRRGRPRKHRSLTPDAPEPRQAEKLDISNSTLRSELSDDETSGTTQVFGSENAPGSAGCVANATTSPSTASPQHDSDLYPRRRGETTSHVSFQSIVREQLRIQDEQNIGQDIARDPESESSQVAPEELSGLRDSAVHGPQSDYATMEPPISTASSSSPILTKRPVPAHVYTRTSTPGMSAKSSLLKHVHKRRSAVAATPVRAEAAIQIRASSVAADGRRRVVYTPARDADDSEDELA